MVSSYTTSFSLEKIGSGDQSGSWGTTENHNWDIVDRLSAYSAVTVSSTSHTLTVREASPGSGTENLQSGMYRVIKFSDAGDIGGDCTVTIAPNTAQAWFVLNNSLSASRAISLTQGSGANVAIPNGLTVIVYCDGAGSGAAVVDAFSSLKVTSDLTIGAAAAADTKIVFDGNAQDFHIGLDDSADDLVLGVGSALGTTTAMSMDENQNVVFPAGNVTIGDNAGTNDDLLIFDGASVNFHVGLDHSSSKLVIGSGSTAGTDSILTLADQSVTLGDAAASDVLLFFDGNAIDFHIALDDTADKLVIGSGSTAGTNSIMALADQSVTLGDAAASDIALIFDGNAQNYYIGLDDSEDDLVIGLGSTVGTTPAFAIDENQVTTFKAAAVGATNTDTSNTGGITLDFQVYQNFVLTFTGNVTLDNPTTEAVGQSGIIVCIQDATGSRTLSLGTDYETAGGSGITLSTAASSVDVIPYFVKASASIQLGAVQKAFA